MELSAVFQCPEVRSHKLLLGTALGTYRYNRDSDDLDPEVRTLHFNDHYQYESSTDPESEPEPAPAMLDLPMGDAPEIEVNYPEASTVALAGSIARL
ncbi:hypothetical protein J6590_019098 [Homalodisca vitripennis]|nr:hypothetical protein J6590_019098 [Homalodisca vitripennis]